MFDTLERSVSLPLLIVENDQPQCAALLDLFAHEGFKVVTCGTACEALERLGATRIGVAVVDLRLPDVGGLELVARMRTTCPAVQIIVHTSYASVDAARNALNLGVFALVEKGDDPADLVRHVHRAAAESLRRYAGDLEAIVASRTAELGASQERFRELFENMSSGVAIYAAVEEGADFVICDFNSAGERISRVRREEVIGRRITEAFPGVRDFGLLDVLSRVWRTGRPDYQPPRLYIDGRLRQWFENRIFRLPSGEVVAVYEDVSERCRADMLLRMEHKLALAFTTAGDLHEAFDCLLTAALETEGLDSGAVYLVDEATGALELFCHQGLSASFAERGAHFEADSDYAHRVRDGLPRCGRPEELAGGVGRELAELEGLRAAAVVPVCWAHRVIAVLNVGTRTLEEIPSEVRRSLETVAAQIGGILARTRTEQARRTSEATLHSLFRAAPIGIGLVRDRIILLANEQLSRMTGYSAAELTGCSARLLYPDEAEFLRVGEVKYAQIRAQGCGHVETRWRCRDGTMIHVLLSSAVIDAENPAAGLVFTAVDITDRKRVEVELAGHREHLEELVEQRTRELEESRARLHLSERLASVGTLAAGIAHEINNPVGMILLSAQNALQHMNEPSAGEIASRSLRKIADNARRCGQIVKSVLQFAREERTERWPAHLRDVLHHVLEVTRPYAQERGAIVHTETDPDLPEVLMNPVQMEQVLANLLRNAFESAEGGVRVEVRLHRAGDTVQVIVRDNGRGILPEQRARLFDPFHTTRRREGGAGLGLSMAHGIITDHGGSIDVQSEIGLGTTVTIVLPLDPAPPGEVCHDQGTGGR